MKSLYLALCGILLSTQAYAYELGGVAITGEANFDYSYLSSGENFYPTAGVAVTPHNQYHFQQAQLLFKKDLPEFSFLARLSYWPVTHTTPAGDTTSSLGMLDQLEVYYKMRPDLHIGFGRLCSTLGFESFFKSENLFYSTAIAYLGMTPGYNEGLRLRYLPNEYINLAVSSYNRSYYNLYGDDYAATKTTELSASGALGQLTWFAGHYYGVDKEATGTENSQKSASNAYATYTFAEDVTLSVIYDARTKKVDDTPEIYTQSWTAQVGYRLGKHLLGLRYESLLGAGNLNALNDGSTSFFGNADKVEVISVVDKITVTENLLFYVEYRHHMADEEVFKNTDDEDKKSGHIITLGAVAHF